MAAPATINGSSFLYSEGVFSRVDQQQSLTSLPDERLMAHA